MDRALWRPVYNSALRSVRPTPPPGPEEPRLSGSDLEMHEAEKPVIRGAV